MRARRRITVAAPSVGPLGVAGCVLWLRADLGVTKDGSNYVSEWRDQSASGLIFTAAGGARPLWKSAEIGGRDSIRGDGATDMMSSTTTLDLSAATGFTWLGVLKDTATSAGRAFEISTNANAFDGMYFIPGQATDTGQQLCANGAASSRYENFDGASLTSPTVYTWRHDSTLTGSAQLVCWANGSSLTNLGSGGGADTGSGFGNANVYLFARAGVLNSWPGDFSEIILYSRVITTEERQRVERHLGARYGISVA